MEGKTRTQLERPGGGGGNDEEIFVVTTPIVGWGERWPKAKTEEGIEHERKETRNCTYTQKVYKVYMSEER